MRRRNGSRPSGSLSRAGLRWEREQLPPPIALLNNPELPQTEKIPALGNNWGPRVSVAMGSGERHWPVLRLGYGMYFWPDDNSSTRDGADADRLIQGDLNFFMRPTDNLQPGGSPPFPYVLAASREAWSSRGRWNSRPVPAIPRCTRRLQRLSSNCPGACS